MSHRRALIGLLILGAAPLWAQPTRCTPETPPGARGFAPPDVLSLAGAFVLLSVDTTRGAAAAVQRAYELVLWPNDATRQAGYRRVGHEPGARPLGGTARIPEAAAPDHRTWTPPEGGAFSVVFLDGALQIGTIDSLDGWRNIFAVHWRSAAGFGGRWTADLGIAVVVDSAGRRLPNPAGYYCAWRVPRFADAPWPPT